MHKSFLYHENYRYLKWSIVLCALSAAAYLAHSPPDGPNGGTWLGYTLGTIGALLILWLAWFGIRKRRYRSRLGTVRGWLSAHVYLGASLVVVATLHTGFQFGLNIHTLAYALMMFVVLSGFAGIFAYTHYPVAITESRAGSTPDGLMADIAMLDQQALELADKIDPQTHAVVLQSIQNTKIGGSALSQLLGHSDSTIRRSFGDGDDSPANPATDSDSSKKAGEDAGLATRHDDDAIEFMAQKLFETQDEKNANLQRLMSVFARKRTLVSTMNRDITNMARLRIWLYVHVPLSVALIGALIGHIISVFLYW